MLGGMGAAIPVDWDTDPDEYILPPAYEAPTVRGESERRNTSSNREPPDRYINYRYKRDFTPDRRFR